MYEQGQNDGLTRNSIKIIALVTMAINHIANIFLLDNTLICEIGKAIGYFTAPCMIYFLVEGFFYTRSRKRYLVRLLLFALLSQFPFSLAFSEGSTLTLVGLNMLFTLALCFVELIYLERTVNPSMQVFVMFAAMAASIFCDWAVFAPFYTFLFFRAWQAGNTKIEKRKAYAIAALAFLISSLVRYGEIGLSIRDALLFSFLSAGGVAAAGFVITEFYHGKIGSKTLPGQKWFFYIFYPAHLLLLGLLRITVL